MDTMAERIKRAMLLRDGMTPAQLIEKTGLSRAGVYFLLDGTTKADKVRAETVNNVCKALRVNRDWLLHGRGPVEGPDNAQREPDWYDVKGYAQAVGLGKGAEAQEYAETHKLKFKASSFAKKQLRPDALAVCYGSGDSMEERIHAGDAVLFDTSDTKPKDDALFVIQVHGDRSEYQVKRCEILDDIIFFKADNPNGDHQWKKPRRIDNKKAPIEIIGRVRWIGSWED